MKQYTIGRVSKILDIPIKTIRFYDQIGLVHPEYIDPNTSYRYYTLDQCVSLNLIRCLSKQLGMPIKTIREYMKNSGDPEALKEYLKKQAVMLDAQLNMLLMRKSFINRKLESMALKEYASIGMPNLRYIGERTLSVKEFRIDSGSDEAIIYLRRCISDTGSVDDREMYILYNLSDRLFVADGARDVLIGMDARGETNYQRFILPAGKYLCILSRYRQGRDNAVRELRQFIEEFGISVTGKMIFFVKITDLSAVVPEEQLVELQILTK
jgi:MerR family transcriptional activator of bmr gene